MFNEYTSPAPTLYSWQNLMPKHWPFWIAVSLIRLVVLLPYSWIIQIGKSLGYFLFFIQRKQKKKIKTNITHCFPSYSEKEKNRLCLAFYQSLSMGWLEAGLAWWSKPSKWQSRFQVEGFAHLSGVLNHNKGVIILYCHQMILELAGRFLSSHLPLTVVYRPHKNTVFDNLMAVKRKNFLQGIIPKHNVRHILTSLKANQTIAVAPDQNMGAPFFGIPSRNIMALVRLAKISGAKIVPVQCYRNLKDKTYHLKIFPPLSDFPSSDLKHDALKVCHFLKHAIEQHPEQYLWLQRRIR